MLGLSNAAAVVVVVCAICVLPAVLANSAGAPADICKNNLTPEHGLDGQSSPPPYSFSGADGAHAGEPYTLKLSGDGFLGFAVQARNADDKPIGVFKIIETNKSQILKCDGQENTVTHKKINSDDPIKGVEMQWTAPKDFKGKVQFVATVAKNGGTYWIRKVQKTIQVA